MAKVWVDDGEDEMKASETDSKYVEAWVIEEQSQSGTGLIFNSNSE